MTLETALSLVTPWLAGQIKHIVFSHPFPCPHLPAGTVAVAFPSCPPGRYKLIL